MGLLDTSSAFEKKRAGECYVRKESIVRACLLAKKTLHPGSNMADWATGYQKCDGKKKRSEAARHFKLMWDVVVVV